MAITKITVEAVEKSTYIVTCAFTDENGDEVTPKSIAWKLSNDGGTVIAEGTVAAGDLAASVDILLSGDTLAILAGETGIVYRRFTIEAVYDSDLGSNLPLKDSCKFILRDLAAVS